MATLMEYYIQAQLSQASYAIFTPNMGLNNYRDALTNDDVGMSAKQAVEFTNTYNVINQYTDPDSGFSGTVFQNKDQSSPDYGKYYIAIRGTDSLVDDWINTNIAGIGGNGIATMQAISMYNWLQRLKGAVDTPVVQYHYVEGYSSEDLYGVVTEHPATLTTTTIAASGLLYGVSTSLSVTGHSLGGHLAMTLSRLAPNIINEVYTYNAPGFDTAAVPQPAPLSSQGFFNLFIGDLGDLAPVTGPIRISGWNDDIMSHFSVEGDVVHTIGTTPGQAQNIYTVYTESANQGWIDAHDMEPITAALALYAVFEIIDPTIDSQSIYNILKASAPQSEEDQSLESALESLSKITNTAYNGSDFYEGIYAILTSNNSFAGFSVKDLTRIDLDSFIELVDDDIAYRYALLNLNPFAVNGANYSSHNTDGVLELFGETAPNGMTDQYIEDRARFLSLKTELDKKDSSYTVSIPSEPESFYSDLTDSNNPVYLLIHNPSGSDLNRKRYIFDGSDGNEIGGGFSDDHIYGGEGDDTLNGAHGNDYLEGNQGDDTLIGGDGHDTLNGGEGSDNYIYISGSGADTILDSDGEGKFVYDGIQLEGGKKKSPGVFVSDDEKFTFVLKNESDGTQSLLINRALTLKNYVDGDLGIHLNDPDEVVTPSPATTREIFGDLQPLDSDPETGGIQQIYDDLDNVVVTDIPEERSNILNGSEGNDHISGLAMNDFLYGNGGDDLLEGGTESDLVVGGAGNDDIRGNADLDVLIGLSGNDILFTNTVVDLPGLDSFENYGGITASGMKGDWATSGLDDDTLVGDGDDEVLLGGGGDDLIISGAGVDIIDGDIDYRTASFNWDVTINETSASISIVYGNSDVVDTGASTGGQDVIYAGYGNDYVYGNIGNDYLYGESGNDVVGGGDGADYISGGEGNDVLIGDLWSGGVVGIGTYDDFIDGGDGDDQIQGDLGDDTIIGGAGNDSILGDDINTPVTQHGNDYLYGGDGSDTIAGLGGDDFIDGGAGDDSGATGSLKGGAGNDVIFGGDGNDYLFGDDDNLPVADHGIDYLYGQGGNDYLRGQGGNDHLDGGEGNDQLLGEDGDDYLIGSNGNDQIFGMSGLDYLLGGNGDDQLVGGEGDDIIVGGTGDDELFGSEGNDTLNSDTGNDWLQGGGGDDTYVYTSTWGTDYIYDIDGDNIIVFDASVPKESLEIFKYETDVFLYINDNEYIGVTQWYSSNPTILNEIAFSDGTIWDSNYITQHGLANEVGTADSNIIVGSSHLVNNLAGNDGNDMIHGGPLPDNLSGDAGNDLINGSEGNDYINGGIGNDELNGGQGDDTYEFNSSWGQDLIIETGGMDNIVFGDGIASDEIKVSRSQDSLYLYNSLNEIIVIQNYFISPEARIEVIHFSDGTIWNVDSLLSNLLHQVGSQDDDSLRGYVNEINHLSGLDGNDRLIGSNLADTLEGGTGNDILQGGGGADLLYGGLGEDQYYLDNSPNNVTIQDDATDNAVNIIHFTPGISSGDIISEQLGNNLVLYWAAAANTTTITDYFNNPETWQFHLASGTIVNNEAIDNPQSSYYSFYTIFDIRELGIYTEDFNQNVRIGFVENTIIDGASSDDVILPSEYTYTNSYYRGIYLKPGDLEMPDGYTLRYGIIDSTLDLISMFDIDLSTGESGNLIAGSNSALVEGDWVSGHILAVN